MGRPSFFEASMKVTPITKKFGKYQPGDEFDLPDKAARVLITVGKLREVVGYQTRMLSADAPYGYKSDGTPRKRPGRPVVNE